MVKQFLVINKHTNKTTIEYSFDNYKTFLDKINEKVINNKYSKNKIQIIKHLAIKGSSSTWNIGEIFQKVTKDSGENYARRIIMGRKSRGKKIPGLIDLGIVDKIKLDDGGINYHLSVYGLLFAIKLFDFSTEEWKSLAENNSDIFPMIFSKIDYLQKNKIDLNILKIIAEGNFSEITRSITESLFYSEMLNILLKDFPIRFSMSKEIFSAFVSYWFYTYLYYRMVVQEKEPNQKWIDLIKKEPHLNLWYSAEISSAFEYYSKNHKKSESIMYVMLNS
jgi:hypothetical protein